MVCKKSVYKWPWSKEVEARSVFDRLKPRFWIWEAEDSDVIKVTDAKDLEILIEGFKIQQQFNFWNDSIKRGWGQYTPAYHRSKDDSLWLRVNFIAKKEWEGHLQFVGLVTDDNRGFNRVRIKISQSPSLDMSDFKCLRGLEREL